MIRRATKADLPALIRLNAGQHDYHAKLDPILRTGREMKSSSRTFFLRQIPRRNGRVFVAVNGKRVVGFLLCELQKQKKVYRQPVIGFVSSAFVEAGARRSGAGAALLKEATAWLKSKKMQRIELAAMSGNAIGIAFWEKNGFRERMKRFWKKI